MMLGIQTEESLPLNLAHAIEVTSGGRIGVGWKQMYVTGWWT
jgi:hypothetical protein